MEKEQHYQQKAFDFTPARNDDTSATDKQTPAASQPERPTTQFHTLRPSGRREDDLKAEYWLEVDFREEHGMPQVSLEEFQDMRDWSDHEPPQDVAWPAQPYTVYERKKT